MSNNNHTDEHGDRNNNGNGFPIDPCAKRIRDEAEYNRKVRCQHCKLIFCIVASVAVAAAIVLLISGAVAIWPPAAQNENGDDENLPLILTIPNVCCQDNGDDKDDKDRDYKHKDKHHDDDDDDDDD